jgi:hypothetical protein
MDNRGEVRVGDIWERREALTGDDAQYNKVYVGGLVSEAGLRPDEYAIKPADQFGETLQVDKSSLIDHCTLLSRADDADEDWVTPDV